MKRKIVLLLIPLLLLVPLLAQASTAQAPIGIASYSYIKATQWLGTIHIISFPESEASFQLNVPLNYEYDGKTYVLWVQNVVVWESGEIAFVDNIWNLTGLTVSGLKGYGNIYSFGFMSFYGYATNFTPISIPKTIYLLTNVTTDTQGEPVIYFWYNDGDGWINYDIVVVQAPNSSNVYLFSSPERSPLHYYYDAALIIGGYGGGASTDIVPGTVVYLQLFYWNGHNFQEVENAYDVGYDTGETSINAFAKAYVNSSNGALEALITEGNESFYELWSQNNVSTVTVYSPVDKGYIYVYNASLPFSEGIKKALKVQFVGGEAMLTLYPMDYAVLVYAENGSLVGEANVHMLPGQSTSTNTTPFSLSIIRQNGQINVIIHAYGNVTINILSPFKEMYTTFVDGIKIIHINAYGTVVVNASLFPGFYIIKQLSIPAQLTFHMNVPETNVTFIYPNETEKTVTVQNGETVEVPLDTKYIVQQYITKGTVRWALPSEISGVVNKTEQTVSVMYYEQRLVSFNYKIINGKWNLTPPNVSYQYFSKIKTAKLPAEVWVNYNSTFNFTNVTVDDERIVLTKVVEDQSNTIAYYSLQYYVNVNTPIPLESNNITLKSGWYNAGTIFHISNVSYVTKNVRYVITSVSPSFSFMLNSPITINATAVKQFLVVINGIAGWYNQGQKIRLIAEIPFYETGVFTGTYNVSPGNIITVNTPITEKLVTHLNYYLFIILLIVAVIGAIIVRRALNNKKKRKKKKKSTVKKKKR